MYTCKITIAADRSRTQILCQLCQTTCQICLSNETYLHLFSLKCFNKANNVSTYKGSKNYF